MYFTTFSLKVYVSVSYVGKKKPRHSAGEMKTRKKPHTASQLDTIKQVLYHKQRNKL